MTRYQTHVRIDFSKLCQRLSRQFNRPVGLCRAQHWLNQRGFTFDGVWRCAEPAATRHFHPGELLEAWEVEAWEVADAGAVKLLHHIQHAPPPGHPQQWDSDLVFIV